MWDARTGRQEARGGEVPGGLLEALAGLLLVGVGLGRLGLRRGQGGDAHAAAGEAAVVLHLRVRGEGLRPGERVQLLGGLGVVALGAAGWWASTAGSACAWSRRPPDGRSGGAGGPTASGPAGRSRPRGASRRAAPCRNDEGHDTRPDGLGPPTFLGGPGLVVGGTACHPCPRVTRVPPPAPPSPAGPCNPSCRSPGAGRHPGAAPRPAASRPASPRPTGRRWRRAATPPPS